jgi:hypothetical protein
MNRRVYFGAVALYILVLAFLLTDWLVWQPGVTEANVKRIRSGMTLAQVEALLGRPSDLHLVGRGNGDWHHWNSTTGVDGVDGAVVWVGNSDRVTAAQWCPSNRLLP